MEKSSITVLLGFIHNSTSSSIICIDTTDFHVEGKEGKWLAFDSIIVEGKEFCLNGTPGIVGLPIYFF
ncbi:MAG: hypothetical protein ACLVA6_06460 [Dorea sp.]